MNLFTHAVYVRQLRFLGHTLWGTYSPHARTYALYQPTHSSTRRVRPGTNYMDYIQKLIGLKINELVEASEVVMLKISDKRYIGCANRYPDVKLPLRISKIACQLTGCICLCYLWSRPLHASHCLATPTRSHTSVSPSPLITPSCRLSGYQLSTVTSGFTNPRDQRWVVGLERLSPSSLGS